MVPLIRKATVPKYDKETGLHYNWFRDCAYDQGANALGRLSSIEERNPANQVIALTQYGYDPKGRVTSDARTVNGIVCVFQRSRTLISA